ncbi:MAG TPA: polysaccharide deacetylase family protein [Terriglobales bacterium]|nr:polysaccharide deacetylase family protein [Terriglobales bacterium]
MKRLTMLLIAVISSALVSAQSQKSVAERLGYPANSRLLVIHADDLGMMHTVNTAIEEALEKGWVTSASIMVPCPWFPEVAEWAKAHPNADLGIHITLNADWTTYRWRPVSGQGKGSSLLDKTGYLPLLTEYVDSHAKMSDVETEARAQIDQAQAAGIRPSHLDPHMGTIASTADLLGVYVGLGNHYKLPVLLEPKSGRGINAGNNMPVGIDGFFSTTQLTRGSVLVDRILQMMPGVPQSQWFDAYKKMLAPLPPGTYELIVHLAHNDAEIQGATADHPDWGGQWRQNDLDTVSNPEFQKFLRDQGFILVTWKQLSRALSQ